VLALRIVPLVAATVGSYSDPEGITDESALVEYRFHRFGGSARPVLEDPSQTHEDVKKALADSTFRGDLAATLDLHCEAISALASHSLFHVDADERFVPIYRWASPYIKAMIAEAAIEAQGDKIHALMQSRNPPGTKGVIVEALWFAWFKLTSHVETEFNRLSLKQLGSKPLPTNAPAVDVVRARLLGLDVITEVWCSKVVMAAKIMDLQERVAANPTLVFLVRPFEHDMMAVDGALILTLDKTASTCCTLLLQATIAETHGSGVEATKFFVQLADAAASRGLLAFVFILPDYRYKGQWKTAQAFAAASVPGAKKATQVEKERAEAVAQFALCPGFAC
jgi:hypothetical protein